MNYLSENQLHLLKELSVLQSIDVTALSAQEFSICEYLESRGFVDIERISCGVNYNGVERLSKPIKVIVTESGKAFLAGLQIDKTRYQRAYRLSIISTVIAGISLLISTISMYLSLC